MSKPFTRRRYIVDWKLQGSLCLHGLLHGGLVLVAIVAGIFLPLLWDLGAGQSAQFEEQAIVMLYMHERLWFLVLGCAAIVVVSAVKLSHRIAGPLVRYKRNLRLMADGKLPSPLRTRPGDYLKEEVECLNAAVAGLTARVEAIRCAQAAVRAELSAVLAAAPRALAQQLEPLAEKCRELDRRAAGITSFDTGDERDAAADAAPVLALAGTGDGDR